MSASQVTVYLVTNGVNGHEYVGVTRFAPEIRWAQHVAFASRLDTYLSRAIRCYGADAFAIEAVASCLSAEDGHYVERAVIQRLRPAYNQTNGGEFTFGRTFTADVLARKSATLKALHRRLTPEQCAAISARKIIEHAHNRRFRASALAALARGRANLNGIENRKRAAGEAARVRVWSDASRAKLSASCMGRVYDQDVIDRACEARQKPIICTTSGTEFASCAAAAMSLGVSTSSIYKVCVGARRSVRGLTFSYKRAAA